MAISVNGYGSRKFLVTIYGMTLCAAIAILAMFLKAEPSAAALLGIGAGITAYNWANVRHNSGSSSE